MTLAGGKKLRRTGLNNRCGIRPTHASTRPVWAWLNPLPRHSPLDAAWASPEVLSPTCPSEAGAKPMNDYFGQGSIRCNVTAAQFLVEVGNVWIGLLEPATTDSDKEHVIANYFDLDATHVRNWIEARGRLRCSVATNVQNRCLNLVGGRVEYDPRLWDTVAEPCGFHLARTSVSLAPSRNSMTGQDRRE